MTTIIEVCDAFRSVGIDDDKARRAAEAISAFETRFASTDFKIEQLDRNLILKIEALKGELTLVKWQVAIVLAGVAAILSGMLALILKAFG